MTSPVPPPSGRGAFASLASRDYRRLWAAQIASGAAMWLELVARPFLVLDVTDGAARPLGAVLSVTLLPQLVFGIWAGALSDWFDRRHVLLADKSFLALLHAAFAAFILSGHLELWHIYVYAFLRGSAMAFDQPARQAMIPALVGAGQLTNAVALMSATQNVVRIVGATAGGVLYAIVGGGGGFGIAALASATAVVFTYRIRANTHVRAARPRLRQMGGGLMEGARFALGHSVLRWVVLLSMTFFCFGMTYLQVFLPLFADQVLEIGSSGYGVFASLTGAGSVGAALFVAGRPPQRVGAVLPGMMMVFGAVMTAFSLTSGLPRPAGLLIPMGLVLFSGGAQTIFFLLARSLVLQATPESLRGRVSALSALDRTLLAAGAAAAGALSAAYGVQNAQIAYALVCVVAALGILIWVPALRGVGMLEQQRVL